MKEQNINRLMNASPFTKSLPYNVFNAILDYLAESDWVTLDNLNIDNLVVNRVSTINKEEYEEKKDDLCLWAVDDDGGYWVVNQNK